MLRPTAKAVIPLDNYMLYIVFDNDEKKIFDTRPYISGNWYSELSDPTYFHSVVANGYSVEWMHGQDLCPDEIYYNSTPAISTLEFTCANADHVADSSSLFPSSE